MSASEVACVNGVFTELDQGLISISDRGLLFGESIYEVCLAVGQKCFLWDEHRRRLEKGLEFLGILTVDFSLLEDIVSRGIEKISSNGTLVYIQITRGSQPRSHILEEGVSPNIIATFRPHDLNKLTDKRSAGIGVSTEEDVRWKFCNIKKYELAAEHFG